MKKDSLEMFARLAAKGGEESTLPALVADRVIETLQSRQDFAIPTARVEWFFGVGSFVAACAALVFIFTGVGEDTLFAFDQLFVLVLP